jgi:phage tail sheath gpL-like
MPIAFDNIPGNIRVPFFYGEVKPGPQGYQAISKLLLIHEQNLSTDPNEPSHAVLDQPVEVFGNEDYLFGISSPLAQMVKIARRNAPFQAIVGLPVTPATTPAKAAGTVTFNMAAPRSASSNFYVNGRRVPFTILQTDTVSAMATKLVAAINADIQMPVTAAAAVGVVTCTAKVGGDWGNSITLAIGVVADDDPLFQSLATVAAMAGGAGTPDITNALANCADTPYDWIVLGFPDGANVALLEEFLSDIDGRWGPYSQLYGHGFWSKDQTFAALATTGNSHNSQHCCFLGQFNYITPPYLRCAAYGAVSAAHLSTFPSGSAPLQTIPLVGVIGPLLSGDRPSIQTRQSLYYDGVAMDRFDELTGQVQVDRTVTTYQHNQWGSPDMTFLDINTPAQVMYAMRRFKADMTQIFGRVALADSNPYNVSNIVTPDDIAKQMCHTYTKLVKDGAFQGADVFQQFLQVEHDANDPDRVNASLPLWCVNQLRILAVAAIVYLQNPTLQIEAAPLAA